MRGLLSCFTFGLAAAGFLAENGGACFGVGALLFAIFITVGLSFNFVTVIDANQREVRRTTTGFWGVPGRERLFAFDDFDKVEVHRDEGQYQLRLMRGWRCYALANNNQDMVAVDRELADLMGIPFVDEGWD